MNIAPGAGLVGAREDRVSRDRESVVDPWHRVRDLDQPSHHAIGSVEGRRVGHLKVHDQIARVLLGNEPRRDGFEEPIGDEEAAQVDDQGDRAEPHDTAYRADVNIRQPGEGHG